MPARVRLEHWRMLQKPALVLVLVLLVAALTLPSAARAAALDCNLTVSNINFGSVDVLPGAAVDVTGSVGLNLSGFGRQRPY
jgi:hypothetical protein